MKSVTQQPNVVDAVGLTKIFNDFWFRPKARAVDGIDFSIRYGEIFGLLGPNGSGKSTTIKMILGLLHKTRGQLSVFGRPPSDVVVKKRIGFLPEESYMYRFLNAKETLDYYGKIFGLDSGTRKRRTEELLEMVGLHRVMHRPVGEYSKGMTRRLGLAQALINDPEFLILDEPTSGLDPIGTRQVKDLILEMGRRGKTILLSSHLLADVEDVCDRIVILYGGKIRAQGTADELLADTDHTIIRTPRLEPETISRIEQVLEREGVGIEGVQTPRQRLEELFMSIVEQARAEQIETSGAVHGGETAKFLRAEDREGEGEGEGLIDSLLREDEHHPAQVAAPTAAAAAAAAAAASEESVLSDLLEHKDDAPSRAVEVGDAPEAPKGVDSDVIDTLLEADDDDREGTGP